MPNGPATYDDLLTGGTQIMRGQHVRMGIGMSPEVDSNMAARALIWSYGGSIQDAQAKVVLNSPEVVDAVAYMTKLFKQTMTDEVFGWTAASNNQGLVAGQLSYILNSISAYRTAQATSASVADDIFFVPALKGPGGKGLASQHVVRSYLVPKWAANVDKIKQFLSTWWERRTARCTTRSCTISPHSGAPAWPRHYPAGSRMILSSRSPRTSSRCLPTPKSGRRTSGSRARQTPRKGRSSTPMFSRR